MANRKNAGTGNGTENMKIKIYSDEWLVWVLDDGINGREVEVTQEMGERWERTMKELDRVQDEMFNALKQKEADEKAKA
jgi:hypothetical protein